MVTPVHPRVREIDGLLCVAAVSELDPVDIINFVVPPSVARSVVDSLPEGPGPLLWFQPGAFDDAVLTAARGKGFAVLAGPCLMVEAGG